MIKKRFLKEYCGKKYGLKEYFTGFAIGFVFGFIASVAMYGNTVVCVAFSTASGFFSSFVFVKNRKTQKKVVYKSILRLSRQSFRSSFLRKECT